jgi:hypothetical protein
MERKEQEVTKRAHVLELLHVPEDDPGVHFPDRPILRLDHYIPVETVAENGVSDAPFDQELGETAVFCREGGC